MKSNSEMTIVELLDASRKVDTPLVNALAVKLSTTQEQLIELKIEMLKCRQEMNSNSLLQRQAG